MRLVLPQVEVDCREASAGHPLVQELVVLVKHRLLDLVHHVAVLTDDLGQRDLSDLGQLSLCEPY